MIKKKKIVWVTPDYFVDVDFPIIPNLLDTFEIHWIVVFGQNNRYSENEFNCIKQKENLTVEFYYVKHGGKNPKQFNDYVQLRKRVLLLNADIIYINIPPLAPFRLPLFRNLPVSKTIVTAHDGSVKSIMRPAWLYQLLFKFGYGKIKYVQMFSKFQATEFEKNFPGHDVTIIPLALKDYGNSSIEKREDCISFVSFGNMHTEKNVGLLIDAADQLYDEGLRGFKVSINGSWQETYDINDRIKHSEIFEVHLGMVPNEEIPNLFGKNHYNVYPYKMMSQSGALKVAFNYHNPVICSNLPGFTDEVIEGIDGYIFNSEDVENLKHVMKKCIVDGIDGYNKLRTKMIKHIDEVYATSSIVKAYQTMFKQVIQNGKN